MLAAREETACSNKFVILRSLAMGGMAEILLARVCEPAKPERLVVLKRMHRQLAADREYFKMFMDEARIATTLRHPNVVEVYESGEDDGQYYIAMEYLHGHDLRQVLSEMAKQQIPMRLENALAITRAVCRGLDYTHKRTDASGDLLGIIHRDVSPHNVLLTYEGRVKLVDFGIAKTSIQESRTRTGILKGKVAYMSPEQAMGEPLDRRSDVFCIGILLWEMTTGHWLYRRKSELETLKAVVEHDALAPSLVAPGYPRELEQIVMKTLARKPEDRWATAGELGEAISAFAKQRRLDLRPSSISTLMSTTFAQEVSAWRTARSAGTSLGDHLVASLGPRANIPLLDDHDHEPDNDSANPFSGEDLPTTVVWPQQSAHSLAPPPRWWQWRPEWEWEWRPPWHWQRRWLIASIVVALAAAGWLVSELLQHDPAPAPVMEGVPAKPSPSPTPAPPSRTPIVPPLPSPVGEPPASPGPSVTPKQSATTPPGAEAPSAGPLTGAPLPSTTSGSRKVAASGAPVIPALPASNEVATVPAAALPLDESTYRALPWSPPLLDRDASIVISVDLQAGRRGVG
jgi:serine/threonine protein kinase